MQARAPQVPRPQAAMLGTPPLTWPTSPLRLLPTMAGDRPRERTSSGRLRPMRARCAHRLVTRRRPSLRRLVARLRSLARQPAGSRSEARAAVSRSGARSGRGRLSRTSARAAGPAVTMRPASPRAARLRRGLLARARAIAVPSGTGAGRARRGARVARAMRRSALVRRCRSGRLSPAAHRALRCAQLLPVIDHTFANRLRKKVCKEAFRPRVFLQCMCVLYERQGIGWLACTGFARQVPGCRNAYSLHVIIRE